VPDVVAMLENSPDAIAAEMEELHARDLADGAQALPRELVAPFLSALPVEQAADVLEYLNEDLRTEVLETMSVQQAAELVTEMTPDDRADTLEDLEEHTTEEILSEIPAAGRADPEKLLAYDPDSAGGLMTTEFVSVSQHTPVAAHTGGRSARCCASHREVGAARGYEHDLHHRFRRTRTGCDVAARDARRAGRWESVGYRLARGADRSLSGRCTRPLLA